MKRLILSALALAAMAGQMMAQDLKITFKCETKALLMTSKFEELHYYSAQFHRIDNAKDKVDQLTDFKDFTMYRIEHKKKLISKIAYEDVIKILELMSNVDPEQKKNMETMFGGESGPAKTVNLGNETVAGRTCSMWKINIGKNVYNYSADPSLIPPIPVDAQEKGNKLNDALTMVLPGMGDTIAKLHKELENVEGIHLKMDVEMSIGPITTKMKREATKIEPGPIPASIFELPKGYKMEDAGKKMVEQLEKAKEGKTK
jgi:hypothetical protein